MVWESSKKIATIFSDLIVYIDISSLERESFYQKASNTLLDIDCDIKPHLFIISNRSNISELRNDQTKGRGYWDIESLENKFQSVNTFSLPNWNICKGDSPIGKELYMREAEKIQVRLYN